MWINLKERFDRASRKRVGKALKRIGTAGQGERIVIYGAGSHTKLLLDNELADKINIIAVCSGNSEGDADKIKGIPVISDSELLKLDFDKILVSSQSFESKIFDKLKNDLKIPLNKIVTIYGGIFHRIIKRMFLFLRREVGLRAKTSPRFSDWYYRYFTTSRQGSIKKIKVSKQKKDAPHLLVFTKRYWSIHVALDTAFALERMRQGWNVTVVGCDTAVPVCDNMFYGLQERTGNHRCDFCSYLLEKHFKRIGFRYVSIRKYLKKNDLPRNSLKERDYGKIVYASWIRLLRSLNPVEDGEFELKEGLMESCRRMDAFFTHFFHHNNVDQVIMTNGKFFSEQLLIQHCKERDISYICYEQGLLKDSVLFAKDSSIFPFGTMEKWEQSKDKPLTPEKLKKLDELDSVIVKSDAGGIPFYSNMVEDMETIYKEHGISKDKETTVLFTNVIWDSAVILEDTIFENMFDWIETTIEFYKERRDKQLIIRVHPVEIKIAGSLVTRQRVDRFISDRFGKLENVIVILPESETSPYKLMDIAELGLVYTSSTGYEMALLGKPVIVSGNTHYGEAGFVHLPKSRDEYIDLLRKKPGPFPDQAEYVKRYIYVYFYEHMYGYGGIISKRDGFTVLNNYRDCDILARAGL